MSFGFGFALPAYPLRGGTGNNPFNQLGPTLDLSFAGAVTDLSDPNGYTLNTNFITPEYQVAAQYSVWVAGSGLTQRNFSDIVTFTRASTATYFNSAGTLTTAAINEARFDYDPSTLAARGLLIEEQRTNNAVWSESFRSQTLTVAITGGTFTNGETVTATGGGTGTYIAADSTPTSFAIFNGSGTFSGTLTGGTSGATATISASTAAWTVNNATITANSTTAPTGTSVADKLVEDTSTGTHITTQSISLGGTVDNSAYVISVFAKASERTRFQLFDNAQASSGITSFDLSNGTVISGTGTITAIGNGWYRCSVFPLKSTSITSTLTIRLISTGTTTSYTGDGTSGIFLFGAQLEAGAFPTSYIPTTTTALTRSADVASVNTLAPWWNASEGTFYVEGSAGSLTNSPIFVMPHDGTSNNYLNAPLLTTAGLERLAGVVGGAAWTNVNTANSTTANTTFKAASAFKAADQAICLNAGTVATGTNASLPVVTTVKLGDWRTSGNSINGYLRRITYYPRRLANADLQTITT